MWYKDGNMTNYGTLKLYVYKEYIANKVYYPILTNPAKYKKVIIRKTTKLVSDKAANITPEKWDMLGSQWRIWKADVDKDIRRLWSNKKCSTRGYGRSVIIEHY
uniref:SlpA domain-containing protein n=1 Tax=Heterorhabditis bacteriophora TaxID=37862 RepID=A0A1I7X5T0_HETBA